MNKEVLETQWAQIRDILREKFSNLTEEDIRQINGRYDQLVAKLQQKYGYTREEAEERIRSWNFDRSSFDRSTGYDRTTGPRERIIRNEDRISRKEDSSDILKWLLAIGIPLLLLGAYFLSNPTETTTTTRAPAQEQILAETPADRAISNAIQNSFLNQSTLASELQNIQVTTHNGVVTLSGFASSREARDSLISAARNTSGVRQVINNLQIR